MRTQSDAELMRRNVTLTEQTVAQLAELKTWTWAGSDSEVLRQALLYYEQWVFDLFEGTELIIRHKDGTEETTGGLSFAFGETKDTTQSIKRSLMLPEPAAERIDHLKEETGAYSDSEVLRNAIGLYNFLAAGILRGGHMIRRFKDGAEHIQQDIPVAQKQRFFQRPRIGIKKAF